MKKNKPKATSKPARKVAPLAKGKGGNTNAPAKPRKATVAPISYPTLVSAIALLGLGGSDPDDFTYKLLVNRMQQGRADRTAEGLYKLR